MNFTAIDFETANRSRASACSIGMAKVRDGEIVETYYELLSPETGEFDYVNMTIHGITPEMVAGKLSLFKRWKEISDFIEDDVLVGHNVSFEQSVINQSFLHHTYDIPSLEYLCTLYMTRVNYPRRMGYKLDDVYRDLFHKPVNHHHALEDAVACAEIAVHHIGKFREQDPRKLIDILYQIPVSQKPEWKKLNGIKPTKEELDPNHPYFEKRFVLTGEFAKSSREQAVMDLVEVGGIYQDGVTKVTDYLVLGDQALQVAKFGGKSGKYKKAMEYNSKGCNIQIFNEEDFWKNIVL